MFNEKDLVNLNFRNIHFKKFEQISDELYKESDKLKKEKKEKYKIWKNSLRNFPSFIIEILLKTDWFFISSWNSYSLIRNIKNQYVSVIISFLWNFNLNNVYTNISIYSNYRCFCM